MVNLSNKSEGTPIPLTYPQRDENVVLPVHENTVVFEVGSAYFRIGWAGESTPRLVIPSCLGPAITQHEIAEAYLEVDDDKATNDNSRKRGESKIENNKGVAFIRPHSADEWVDYLKPKFSHIFVNLFLFNDATPASSLISSRTSSYTSKASNSSGSRIVVLESSGGLGLISNENLQCGMAEVLLKYLHFNSLLFVTGGSLLSSLYCFPYSDLLGLVMDIGHNEARCCVSFQGRYLPQTYQATPCGYRNVAKIFRDLLHQHFSMQYLDVGDNTGSELNILLDDASAILREATVVSGAVEAERNDGVEKKSTIKCTQPSTGEMIEIPYTLVRKAWDEILDGTPGIEETLPAMILSCLKACPIDLRRAVSQHVVIIGGVTQMLASKHSADSASTTSLFKRLKSECSYAARHNPKYSMLQPCCREMQASNLLFAPDVMGWLGGSIMGTLPLSEEPSWIFRQAWMERVEQAGWVSKKADDMDVKEESRLSSIFSKDARRRHPSAVLLPDWQHSGKK